MIDPWPAGYLGPQDHYDNSPTVCRPLTFVRSAPGEHGYARPVEGLIVTFDLDAMQVIDVEDHGVVPLPPQAGNYSAKYDMFSPGNRPAFTAVQRRRQGHRHHPARRSQLHGRRLRGGLAEVGLPGRVQPARGPGAAHHLLQRQGHRAPGHVPRRPLGDGGALRRHRPDPLEQERLRHGRGWHGDVRQPAHPRLRLPGGDLLLRRHRQRQPRQRRGHPERGLHARGGLRDRLEAHRLPYPARSRCAGRGGWSCR